MKKIFIILAFICTNIVIGHAQNWESLLVSMSEAYQAGDLKKATELGYQSLDAAEKEFGKDHESYYMSLESIGLMHFYSKEYAEAIPIFKRSMTYRLNNFGETHAKYILSFYSLANSFNYSGQRDSAEIYYKDFIALCRKYNAYNHESYIPALNNLGYMYFLEGKYKEAIKYIQEVADLRKQFLGDQNASYALALDNVAEIYKIMGDFKNASKTKTKAFTAYSAALSNDTLEFIKIVGNYAAFFSTVNNYEKSDSLFLKYVDYYKTQEQDTQYAGALESYGYQLRQRGDYEKSEHYLSEALTIRQKYKSKYPKRYFNCINYLANTYIEADEFFKGKEILEQALKHPSKSDYPNQLVAIYNNLGLLHKKRGKYEEAINFYNESIKIERNTNGEESKRYATILDNLGNLYEAIGRYDMAEPLFQKSLNIFKSLNDDEELYKIMNNYANLYKSMGNYDKAIEYFTQASMIAEQFYGEESYLFALTMDNLAMAYSSNENNDLAEKYSKIALKAYQKSIGENSLDYAIALNNAATLYNVSRRTKKVIDYYTKALSIYEKIHGKNHDNYALTLSNLALCYHENNELDSAEKQYTEAIEIFRQTVGKFHPNYSTTLNLIAQLYDEKGETKKAMDYFLENSKIRLHQIKQNFTFLNEDEKEKYWYSFSKNFDIFNSFVERNRYDYPELNGELYNNLLITKGLLFKSSSSLRNKIIYSNDSLLIKEFEKWLYNKELVGKIENLSLEERKKHPVNLDSLKAHTEQLEKALNKSSQAFADDKKLGNINWEKVRKKLKRNEAAIEFFSYNQHLQNWTGKRIYAAMILRKDYEAPKFIQICDETELNKILNKTDKRYHVHQYVLDTTLNSELYQLIWNPLDSLVKDLKKIYISLAGLLNKVSFASLTNADNKLLIYDYDFQFVNSTSKVIVDKSIKTKLKNTITLFGGIDYFPEKETLIESAKKFVEKTNRKGIPSRSIPRNLIKGDVWWSYLEGTLNEVKNIDSLFETNAWETTIHTGAEANEEAFKALQGKTSPKVIHISTHGYFLPDENPPYLSKNENNRGAVIGKESKESNVNPLYRSGLIFAGANRVWGGGNPVEGIEDGVLTAYEASNTYLGSTELVVLSACETGLGEIKTGEGVYGLQRSFQLAGADAIIMSLWQVPDKETVELMNTFYKYWLELGDKHQAFRKAQLEMGKKYHPYYWAAFMMLE